MKMILGTKFRLKLTLFEFWIKLTTKRVFPNLKKNENCHRILHIQIKSALSGLRQFLAIESP